jgi:RNA polymerase sigma-70 factor (ECF subfamily)
MHPRQITELFESHAAALTLLARFWCGHPEDAVQAAFIDLADLSTPPQNPRAWLYVTTKRKAQNIARSERRRTQHTQAAAAASPQWIVPAKDAPGIDPRQLQSALAKLSDQERRLVVARIWSEMSFEELATMIDCSVATAFRRYQAALEKLKQLLETES